MVRIFKQQYTTVKNGQKVTRQSRKWYVEYRDADGVRRRVPAYADKAATRQYAAQLEREAEQRKAGLVDKYTEHRKRPLTQHVDDWRKSLLDGGVTSTYAELSTGRVGAILDGTKAVFWNDLDANRTTAYLAERRDAGLSIESSNHYLRRMKQFARWMVKTKRAPDNPLDCLSLQNPRTDRRHDRRPLSDDELVALLDCTRKGPVRHGMSGPERGLPYHLAVETGFRASEIRSLTPVAFDLVDDASKMHTNPTITIAAAYSKRRREDVQPIRPVFARDLVTFLSGRDPSAPVFNLPPGCPLSKLIRRDLEAARAAWIEEAQVPDERDRREQSDFLMYTDSTGRVADFHALRHTYITNLTRGGVHPRLAQRLARHSTITLTMDRYSHTVIGELSAELDALPDLPGSEPDRQEQRATGTEGKSLPTSLPTFLPKCLPRGVASERVLVASDCSEASIAQDHDKSETPMNTGVSRTSLHAVAPACVKAVSLRVLGLEPKTYGLKGRCSTAELHPPKERGHSISSASSAVGRPNATGPASTTADPPPARPAPLLERLASQDAGRSAVGHRTAWPGNISHVGRRGQRKSGMSSFFPLA